MTREQKDYLVADWLERKYWGLASPVATLCGRRLYDRRRPIVAMGSDGEVTCQECLSVKTFLEGSVG